MEFFDGFSLIIAPKYIILTTPRRFLLNFSTSPVKPPDHSTSAASYIPSHQVCPTLDPKNKQKARQVVALVIELPPSPNDRVPRRPSTPAADGALARLCLLLVHQPQTGDPSLLPPVPFLRRGGWNSGSNALKGVIGFGGVLKWSFVWRSAV